jgi:MFS family permease
MFIGGMLLDYFKGISLLFAGFAVLFLVSMLARMVSTRLLTKHYEPHLAHKQGYYFGFVEFVKKMPQNNFGRFALFVALMSFATGISSPFFAVYMLNELKFSYFEYTLILMAPLFMNLLFVAWWGKFADKYGNLLVMKICGLVICFGSLLWIVSPFLFAVNAWLLVAYLMIIEGISGFAWVGFNLSSGNFVYDAVSRERMALCVAYSSILSSIGFLVGVTIGGIIISLNLSVIWLGPILLVFLLSFVMRIIVYLLLAPKIKEVREVRKFNLRRAREKIKEIGPNDVLNIVE